MSQFTIKQIFIDNWDKFVQENSHLNIRPIVFTEVERMINCGNPELGYALYYCEHCNSFISVPFRCKSRFCNTCGVKYAHDRAFNISKKIIRCQHRHIVFTIPKQLRIYFQDDRNLLNGLFEAAAETVLSWFRELNKSQNFTPRYYVHFAYFWPRFKMEPSYTYALL